MEKIRYLLCLFIYALKRESKISINTLFRYAYIYSVSCDYLDNAIFDHDVEDMNKIIIDKDLGIGDYSILYKAMQSLNEHEMINMIDSVNIAGTSKLSTFVTGLFDHKKAKQDLNRIMYFIGVLSNYGEDVILSVFYSEPNVIDAVNRNENVIYLKNNKLFDLLSEFERIANQDCKKDLDKYDVFTTWLDYVLENYVKGKVKYEQ